VKESAAFFLFQRAKLRPAGFRADKAWPQGVLKEISTARPVGLGSYFFQKPCRLRPGVLPAAEIKKESGYGKCKK